MKLTHFAAANWCNFAHIEFDMSSRVFIVGPNSSGKSNLLGALRFLSDSARYGLTAATEDLGGLDRYVHSGADSASFVATFDDAGSSVEYVLKLQRSASDGEGLTREGGANEASALLSEDPLSGNPSWRVLSVRETVIVNDRDQLQGENA